MGSLFWMIWWANIIIIVLKNGEPFMTEVREIRGRRGRDSKCEKDSSHHCWL